MTAPTRCVCGHALSSHRLDPADPYISERCVTCGCAAFDNREDARMQDDETPVTDPTPAALPRRCRHPKDRRERRFYAQGLWKDGCSACGNWIVGTLGPQGGKR